MKKFLFALRSIGLTVVGLIIAILVTTGLHSFFGLFLDPLPMVDLQAADWSGRSNIISAYMTANPFAIYSMPGPPGQMPGKPTAQIGKMLDVLSALGCALTITIPEDRR